MEHRITLESLLTTPENTDDIYISEETIFESYIDFAIAALEACDAKVDASTAINATAIAGDVATEGLMLKASVLIAKAIGAIINLIIRLIRTAFNIVSFPFKMIFQIFKRTNLGEFVNREWSKLKLIWGTDDGVYTEYRRNKFTETAKEFLGLHEAWDSSIDSMSEYMNTPEFNEFVESFNSNEQPNEDEDFSNLRDVTNSIESKLQSEYQHITTERMEYPEIALTSVENMPIKDGPSAEEFRKLVMVTDNIQNKVKKYGPKIDDMIEKFDLLQSYVNNPKFSASMNDVQKSNVYSILQSIENSIRIIMLYSSQQADSVACVIHNTCQVFKSAGYDLSSEYTQRGFEYAKNAIEELAEV